MSLIILKELIIKKLPPGKGALFNKQWPAQLGKTNNNKLTNNNISVGFTFI